MPAIIERRNRNGAVRAVYTITNFRQFVIRLRMPVDAVPIPETGPDLQIITKIHGNSSEKAFRWTIKDEPNDTFSGPAVMGPSRTMFQQINLIESALSGTGVNDEFEFRVEDQSGNVLYRTIGFMTEAEMVINDESPMTAAAMLNFTEGDVSTVAGVDGATPPINPRTCSGAGSGEICYEWDPPADTGTGSPSITDYEIRYQGLANPFPVTVRTGSTSTQYTLQNLVSGTLYTLQVAAVTNNQAGQFSEPISEAAH